MILDLIKKRRAVFPVQYNSEPIADEVISKVLEAANWAPTHRRTEPWRFKVLRGDSKKRLGVFLSDKYQETEAKPKSVKVKKLRDNPQRAAVVILICMQRDPKESVPEWEEIAATAMAVQNMWLMCAELGVGSYWSSPSLIDYIGEFTDLSDGEKCLGLFYMGYYDEDQQPGSRQPIEEKVKWLD